MDEELLELIKLADGCNKCNGCPFANYSEWTDTCHYLGEELNRIYIEDTKDDEDINIFFLPVCELKTIDFRTWTFVPEKINSNELIKHLPEELINLYIKTNL